MCKMYEAFLGIAGLVWRARGWGRGVWAWGHSGVGGGGVGGGHLFLAA